MPLFEMILDEIFPRFPRFPCRLKVESDNVQRKKNKKNMCWIYKDDYSFHYNYLLRESKSLLNDQKTTVRSKCTGHLNTP